MKKIKIIALPFAGGNKYSYRELSNLVPNNYEWETLELPGRGARMMDGLFPDIRQLAEKIIDDLIKIAAGHEYIIYGHSMGTLLGYELTKMLIDRGEALPKLLFFTGKGGPSVVREKIVSNLPNKEFWEEVKDLGGVPEELLENDEILEFFGPIMRADFKAVEDYRYDSDDDLLPVPIFVRAGDQEGISYDQLHAWQAMTSYPLDSNTLPGNHFFIFKHPQHIMRQLIEADLLVTDGIAQL